MAGTFDRFIRLRNLTGHEIRFHYLLYISHAYGDSMIFVTPTPS